MKMEATTTLADALLDDLDDLSDIDDAPKEEEDDGDQKPSATTDADDDAHGDSKPPSASTGLVTSRFLENPVLLRLLITIREHDVHNLASTKSQKEREAEDHQLVVQCNKHLASLADELARAHGDLATAYKPKFPELEELLPNSVQYKNAVRTIWNETDLTKVNDQLNDMLNSNQIITISVAGSTTSGRALDDKELEKVDAAASYMERLLEVQQELVQFVENSMSIEFVGNVLKCERIKDQNMM